MKKFFSNLVAIGVALLFAAVIGAAVYGSFMWPRHKVTEALVSEGYSEIQLSHAFFNRAPIQCGGDDVDLYTYTAVRGQKAVSGFACYRGWVWGVAHWDD